MVEYLPERIAGPRLLLRLPELDDAGALFHRVGRDLQVTKYLQWTPHPDDVAATRRVITENSTSKSTRAPGSSCWRTVTRSSG